MPPKLASNPDTNANMKGYIEATKFATAYFSDHSQKLIPEATLKLLENVNCSYLSHARGKAPTLLELKQHAQALCILIKHLCISTTAGEIDGANSSEGSGAKLFKENEAFDFLNDLEGRYDNRDESHNLPLTSLLNKVWAQTDIGGPQFHCPLEEFELTEDMEDPPPRRPYGSHHGLLMHANECLEMLDHEYSATGGIMSILPPRTDLDTEDMLAARNSLIGQWLFFNQHLVGRMHELEICYAQALDVMAGEAMVPYQMYGRNGVTAHSGREVAFPQDKWILCNAGDDVFDELHRRFDKEEGQAEMLEKNWRSMGVSGNRLWDESRNGEEYAKGMVPIDVVTRFYRLKGMGHSTIFVLPAFEYHPKCQRTAVLEKKEQTVVSVPAPIWPERVSDWEARNKAKLDEASITMTQNLEILKRVNDQTQQIYTIGEELRKTNRLIKHYEDAFGTDASAKMRELDGELDRHRQKLRDLKTTLPKEFHGHLTFAAPQVPAAEEEGY